MSNNDKESGRRGDWRQTVSGKMYWPADPRPEEVDIRDLAHHLATINRFGGAAREPYSVAEHLVRASYIAAPGFELETLLHDAGEGLIGADLIRPVKRSDLFNPLWEDLEARNQKAAHVRLGVPTEDRFVEEEHAAIEICGRTLHVDFGPNGLSGGLVLMRHMMPKEVKDADNVMLMTEVRDLMAEPPMTWRESAHRPLEQKIVPYAWNVARDLFLERFFELGGWA